MLLEKNKLLKLQRFFFENLCENKEQFRSATGLNPDCFMSLFNYLNPGDDCSSIKFYDTSKRLSEEKYTNSDEVKSGPKPKISAKEQLFMYLSWLKNGFTLTHASFLFQNPKATVSRYIVTWANFLYFSLGSVPILPTHEQLNFNFTVTLLFSFLMLALHSHLTKKYSLSHFVYKVSADI